jgi:hypothetical protein
LEEKAVKSFEFEFHEVSNEPFETEKTVIDFGVRQLQIWLHLNLESKLQQKTSKTCVFLR